MCEREEQRVVVMVGDRERETEGKIDREREIS